MNNKEIQFIVDRIVDGEHFTVLGRCGDIPIRVGDAFDAVYRYKRRRYPDEAGRRPYPRSGETGRHSCPLHPCSTSGHCKRWVKAMTGSLTLEGDGLQYLAPGWILGRKSEIRRPRIKHWNQRPLSLE